MFLPCGQSPPIGDTWLHEIKIDGWRCQLIKEGRRIRFFSRRGNDLRRRLSSFAEAFQGLQARSAIVDGELTVADPEGRPDFYALGGAMKRRKRDLMFVAFDLLELDAKICGLCRWSKDANCWPSSSTKAALAACAFRKGLTTARRCSKRAPAWNWKALSRSVETHRIGPVSGLSGSR